MQRGGHGAAPRPIPACVVFLIADFLAFADVIKLRRVDRTFERLFGIKAADVYWSRVRSLNVIIDSHTKHFQATATAEESAASAQEASAAAEEQLRGILGRLRLAEVVRIECADLDDDCIDALCYSRPSPNRLRELYLSRAARVSFSRLTLALSQCQSLHTLQVSNVWQTPNYFEGEFVWAAWNGGRQLFPAQVCSYFANPTALVQ
jgi:hypothetical protein